MHDGQQATQVKKLQNKVARKNKQVRTLKKQNRVLKRQLVRQGSPQFTG